MTNPQPKRVYAGQFGAFWRFTLAEWLAICEEGVKGNGFTLPDGNQLAVKPAFIRKNRRTSRGYWSDRSDVRYVEPLDWSREDFEDEINQVKVV